MEPQSKPEFVKRGVQPYAGIRARLRRDDLPELVPRTLSELLAFLEKHRIHVSGAPLIRYFVVDYNTGEVEIDVGAPVGVTSLPPDDRVQSAQIPAGTFATVIHRGPYDDLMKKTAALLDWAKERDVKWQVVEERKVTRWNARVEHYLVGPPDEPDPKNWQTEIAILVSDGSLAAETRHPRGAS
jgi:effector-binding domain-containing protein